MATVYKILRNDGLFSDGGTWPSFSKKGKIWKRKGDLSSHLSQIDHGRAQRAGYNDCEIIEYELVETEVGRTNMQEYLAEAYERKLEKEKKERERIENAKRKLRFEQYKQLKKEFG